MIIQIVDEVQNVPACRSRQFLVIHSDQLEVVGTEWNDRILSTPARVAAPSGAVKSKTSERFGYCIEIPNGDNRMIEPVDRSACHTVRTSPPYGWAVQAITRSWSMVDC